MLTYYYIIRLLYYYSKAWCFACMLWIQVCVPVAILVQAESLLGNHQRLVTIATMLVEISETSSETDGTNEDDAQTLYASGMERLERKSWKKRKEELERKSWKKGNEKEEEDLALEPMRISIKTLPSLLALNGDTIKLTAFLMESVNSLKSKIMVVVDSMTLKQTDFDLCFNGVKLEKWRLVSEYNIQAGATLKMVSSAAPMKRKRDELAQKEVDESSVNDWYFEEC